MLISLFALLRRRSTGGRSLDISRVSPPDLGMMQCNIRVVNDVRSWSEGFQAARAPGRTPQAHRELPRVWSYSRNTEMPIVIVPKLSSEPRWAKLIHRLTLSGPDGREPHVRRSAVAN